MGEKIDTQGMSVDGDVMSFTTTCPSTAHQHDLIKPITTCFTMIEREEIKQMMREVVIEMGCNTTPSLDECFGTNASSHYNDKYGTALERIRTAEHHGGD